MGENESLQSDNFLISGERPNELPIIKTMELLPLGPVAVIDTPGFDDEGELGSIRVSKTKNILKKSLFCFYIVTNLCIITIMINI